MFGNFVQAIQILLPLILVSQLVETAYDISDFGFCLFNRLNLDFLFLMNVSDVELWSLSLVPDCLINFLLFVLLVLVTIFGLFSTPFSVDFLDLSFQEIFSSEHNVLWSPITSVLVFTVGFGSRFFFRVISLFFRLLVFLILVEIF